MDALRDLREIRPRQIWDSVAVRTVDGERLTLGIIELDPNAVVPEHRHDHEQLGIVLEGSVRFRIGDETRALERGGTWRIPSNVPHEVEAGPDGAVVIDVFAPVRDDWASAAAGEPRVPRWPS